jgi:hypothetical protein
MNILLFILCGQGMRAGGTGGPPKNENEKSKNEK